MNHHEAFAQRTYQLRFDWGLDGARRIARDADLVVLVDALSFTTAVVVAADHGVPVAPWGGDRAGADAFAAELGASVAAARSTAGFSLSPASFVGPGHPDASAAAPTEGGRGEPDASAATPTEQGEGRPDAPGAPAAGRQPVVLPSPNGGAIARAFADGTVGREPSASEPVVLAASLRNRTAVAQRVLELQEQRGTRLSVAVIAAGEHAESSEAPAERRTLRFAVEDQLAAGAVIDALAALGIDHTSPEAAAACASFEGLRRAVVHLTSASGSGVELRERGFAEDVRLASEIDASEAVPELRGGVFRT